MSKKKSEKEEKKPSAKKAKPVAVASVEPEKAVKAKEPKAKKASKPAVKKTVKAPAISGDDIALRAYFIAERRHKMGWPGDSTSDWVEAERQLKAEAARKRYILPAHSENAPHFHLAPEAGKV